MLGFNAIGFEGIAFSGALSQAAALVTAVLVTPDSAAAPGGSTLSFSASVLGLNSPSQGVTWATSAGSISTSGVLTAPATTPGHQYVTVTATSVADPTKSRSVTIVVPGSNPPSLGAFFQARTHRSRRVLRLS